MWLKKSGSNSREGPRQRPWLRREPALSTAWCRVGPCLTFYSPVARPLPGSSTAFTVKCRSFDEAVRPPALSLPGISHWIPHHSP